MQFYISLYSKDLGKYPAKTGAAGISKGDAEVGEKFNLFPKF